MTSHVRLAYSSDRAIVRSSNTFAQHPCHLNYIRITIRYPFFSLCDWFLLNMNQSQNTEEQKKVGVLLWSDLSHDRAINITVHFSGCFSYLIKCNANVKLCRVAQDRSFNHRSADLNVLGEITAEISSSLCPPPQKVPFPFSLDENIVLLELDSTYSTHST